MEPNNIYADVHIMYQNTCMYGCINVLLLVPLCICTLLIKKSVKINKRQKLN